MARGDAIASGSVVLTANADGLKTGLDAAAKSVGDWGKKATRSAKSGGEKEGLAGAVLGSFAKGGAFAAGGMAIKSLLGGGGGGGGGGGLLAIKDTLEDIKKQGDISKALGLTAEQFTGMAGVAKSVGEDTREFLESIVTMGKLGTDAAAGTEQASAAFKAMGLNANEFIKLRADEQFFQIFESISKIQDPLQKTRTLMQAFGEDGGKYLLPLLGKTPDQLKEMAKGFAITGEEVKKATAATAATKQVEATVGKLFRGIAVAAAPLIEKFATVAGSIVEKFQPAIDWLSRYFDRAALLWGGVWDAITAAVQEAAGWISSTFGEFFGSLGELPTIQDAYTAVFRAVGTAGAYMWDTLKAGAGFFAIGAGTVIGLVGDLADTFKGTFKSIALGGAEAAKALGATDTEAKFRKVAAAADSIAGGIKDAGAAAVKWGEGAVAGFGGSGEQFNKWLDKLLQPKAAGAELGAAVAAGLAEGASSGPVKLAGAIARGSQEAYSMVLKNQMRQYGGESNDPQKQLVKEAKKGNGLAKDGNKKLAKIEDHLAGLGVI